MGNVFAASQQPAAVGPPTNSGSVGFGALPKTTKDSSGNSNPDGSILSTETDQRTGTGGLNLENPGTIEDLHKKCKEVIPTNFEGGRLMFQKGLSNHFHVSHTVNLSSSGPSGYRFGATYIGANQVSYNEAYPILLGEMDPAGNLSANVINLLTPNIRYKIAAQIQNSDINVAQLTADIKGADYTASVLLGNINVLNTSGVIVGHYLQSVTKRLAVGGELAYQYGNNVPGGEIAVVSAVARYAHGLSTWSGTLGVTGLHLCYHQKASEQLQFGVEMETNFRAQESVATVAYQADLPRVDIVFRGMVDSNWTVGAVMEKKLQPLPFTFALSGLLNHAKNTFKLGVAMIIG